MDTILVIENDSNLLKSIIDLLREEGYHALGAENGQQGIVLTGEHVPNLILCDIMMSDITGYDVLYVVRGLPETATVPFVFITALSEKRDLRRSMNLGADDFLTKPFSAEELLEVVETQLRKQKAQVHEQNKAVNVLRKQISKIVPHELRTPLMSIVGFARMLKLDWRELDSDVVDEMLTDIRPYTE